MIIYNQQYEDEAWEMFRSSVGSHYTKYDLLFWFLIGMTMGVVISPFLFLLV